MSRAEARGGRASGRGRAVRSHGRCALSRQLALRPGGSAHRCSTESPSSRRRAAQLIGDDRAGRAHPRKLPHSGTCRRTAARLRALCSTCAAQCNGAAGHNEEKVWRRRRRGLGWAQGVCRAGRTVGDSTFRRDSWHGLAEGNAVSAQKTAWSTRKKLSGGVQQQSGGNPWGAAQMQPSGSSSSSATASASSSPSPHHPPQPPQLVGRPAWPPHVRLRPHRAQLSRICAPRLAAEAAARWSMYTARWRRGSRRLPPAGQ